MPEAKSKAEKADTHQSKPQDRWIGRGADLAVIVSAVLMMVIYYWQRQDAKEHMRRDTTVDLIALRYSDRIVSAEQGLNDYMIKNYNLYTKTELAPPSGVVPDVKLPAKTRDEFALMIDFYSDLLACGDSQQCEPALINQWFAEDICQFAKMGEIIGFPQMRDQFGSKFLERLTAYHQNDCRVPS